MDPTCEICDKKYSCLSAKNLHMRKFHGEVKEEKKQHILCIMCPSESQEKFFSHNNYINHLANVHNIDIKKLVLSFTNIEEFETWRREESREVDYACVRRNKLPNGNENVYYSCNRSDYKGFVSVCQKRSLKTKGSIHIHGTCPSQISVKILSDGMVAVTFIETHVGHSNELRSKHLTKSEQECLHGQLSAGISTDRIIKNARLSVENNKLERINTITKADLSYLIRKFNIDKKRNTDDMIATTMKIDEWNRQGKDQAFLVKKIGEAYPGLKNEDFAVGYMNSVMERKLRDFKRVVCVDGTHGTNRKNWELTIVLVKDENNMGFPVSFLLSNRMDQTIQEIFFRALRSRLGESIEAEYLMSDDDPKYFNAWSQVMTQTSRRLLCTWHIIKNWNIQGRSKIKKIENRKEMKTQMRQILTETDIDKFLDLKEKYFQHLAEEGEDEFLKYLQKYYFQSEERVMMWAHCHRKNAGVNTNMAIESLNKVLKHNKMMGQKNIRVEKLLDLLDELVDEKMWKCIINNERPNANNYQHKTLMQAHKKAEQMDGKVNISEFGKFMVNSPTVSEKFYVVSFKELCDNDCRSLYCPKCKICWHRYECQCPEYTVKNALCKHIHAVAIFEQRSESVLGISSSSQTIDDSNTIGDSLHIDEPTTSKIRYQENLTHFIEESCSKQESDASIAFEQKREIVLQEMYGKLCGVGRTLDAKSFDNFMGEIGKVCSRWEQNRESSTKKRKVEKQSYYPNKKKGQE